MSVLWHLSTVQSPSRERSHWLTPRSGWIPHGENCLWHSLLSWGNWEGQLLCVSSLRLFHLVEWSLCPPWPPSWDRGWGTGHKDLPAVWCPTFHPFWPGTGVYVGPDAGSVQTFGNQPYQDLQVPTDPNPMVWWRGWIELWLTCYQSSVVRMQMTGMGIYLTWCVPIVPPSMRAPSAPQTCSCLAGKSPYR